MKRLFYILLMTISLPGLATNKFQTLYGDAETDRCRAFTTTSDGGYCIIGTNRAGSSTGEITAYRLDNSGSLLWSAKLGTVKDDEAGDIKETSDGGFIITGNTYGSSMDTAHTDIFVLKIDDQGFPVWSASYGGQSNDVGNCIIINPAGGYFVLGSTESFGNVDQSALLMKINNNGIQEWSITLNATNLNSFSKGILNASGKIIAGGYCVKNSGNDTDMIVAQIDTSGTIDWGKRLISPANDQIYAISPFTGGGYLLAGAAGSSAATDADQNLTCIESNGNIRWSRNWGKTLNDAATSIFQNTNQKLIIGGRIDVGNPFLRLFQMSLIETDTLGNVSWAHTYGDPSVESEGFGALPGTNGGFVSVGYSITSGDPYGDTYFVKTDETGNSGCFELPLNAVSSAAVLTDSSGLDSQNLLMDENPEFLNWQSFINQFTQNCFNDFVSETAIESNLFTFPNPCNDMLTLKPSDKLTSIFVYNSLGQTILSLSNLSTEISINTTKWENGLYVIRGDGRMVAKILVQH